MADNHGVVGWIADVDFVIRGSVAPKPDGGMELLVRDSRGRPVAAAARRCAPEDALTTSGLAFDLDGGRLLAVSSVGANAGRLVWIDVATGAVDVVAEDPTYDVGGVTLDPDTRVVQAVTFQKDRAELVVLDAGHRAGHRRPARRRSGRAQRLEPRRRGPPLAGRLHRRRRTRLVLLPGIGRPRRQPFSSITNRRCRDYVLAPMEPFSSPPATASRSTAI